MIQISKRQPGTARRRPRPGRRSASPGPSRFVTIATRLSAGLDEIVTVPIGERTLEAILESGNQLTIRHWQWALQAAGRTLALLSDKLSNGQGSDVEILFDARIPEQGSHAAFDSQRNSMEFTALQNLSH